MYSIIKYTKTVDLSPYDYVFKRFDEFYKIADLLYLPLIGVYKLAITTTEVVAVEEFISNQDRYSHLSVDIYMEEQALQIVENANPEANFETSLNTYEVFKKMISERRLLFDRYMIYRLYRSIEHNTTAMMMALDKIADTYKQSELLTEDKLSKIFIINDIVYPSQVLFKFLNMEPNRWKLFNVCASQIDNDVLVGSVVKEIRKLVESKAEYFKSGDTNDRIKTLNTQNLIVAYWVFIADRAGVNDAHLLFKFYENGVSANDIRGGSNVSI